MRIRAACAVAAMVCLAATSLVSTLNARGPNRTKGARRSVVPVAQKVTRVRPADPASRAGKLLAAQRPLAESGRIPVYQIRDPRLDVPKPVTEPAYLGTRVVVGSDVKGDARRLQEEIAAALSRLDFCPDSRRAHFAWLEHNPNFKDGRARLIGWSGGILGLEPAAGGSWLVHIRVRPWLYSPTMRRTLVMDHVIEHYEYAAGKLRFVDSDAAIANPDRQVFPVAQ